jgi:pyrroline-5-carboxylate reductase
MTAAGNDPAAAASETAEPPPLRLGVLGSGKMGGALVRGWTGAGVVAGGDVRLYDTSRAAAEAVAAETGAFVVDSATDAATDADLLLVSVKPHLVGPSLAAVRDTLPPHCLVVSVAAGVRLAAIEEALAPRHQPAVRVMPNTPALVGAGAAAFCRGRGATDAHAALIAHLFGAVGRAVEVAESQIDAVTGVSGSGPAYFYLMIEALTDGGVRAGLPRDVARTLAAQTALGAAAMVLETGEHPAALKDAVTTPGGTTIAALAVLEAAGVRSALIEAVRAAAERAREMG